MKIVVNKFTYDSGIFKVNVGDTVLLPYPSWHPDNGKGDGIQGVVEQINSNYTGYLRPILGVVKRSGPEIPVVKAASVPAVNYNPPQVPPPASASNPVKVKEIEALIRAANVLVIDNVAFRYYNNAWHRLS